MALVSLASGVIYLLGISATATWERYADTLRDGGQPLTYQEIAERETQFPHGPTLASAVTGMESRLLALASAETTRSVWIFDSNLPDLDTYAGIPRRTVGPTRALVARSRDLLDTLPALAVLPAGHVPRSDEANLFEFALPALTHVRNATKLLRIEAILALMDGNPAVAVMAVHLQRRLNETVDEHPTMIGRLVQCANNDVIVSTIEDTLRLATVDARALEALSEDVDDRLRAATMKWALLGERAQWIELCDQMATGELPYDAIPGTGNQAPTTIGLPTCVVRWSEVRGAELLTTLIDAHEEPAVLIEAARQMALDVRNAPATLALLEPLMADLTNACIIHARRAARLRGARAALAAERFRLANDRLPGSIEELAPQYLDAIPTDPFDGQPLRLATTEQGIVIYSLGENGQDDGGDVARTPEVRSPPDEGFRLVRPEHRGIVLLDDPPPDDG